MRSYKDRTNLSLYRLCGMLFCSSSLFANGITAVENRFEARLERSLELLSSERRARRETLLPLRQRLGVLKAEESEWRQKMEQLQSIQDSKSMSLEDLKAEVEGEEGELRHLEEVLVKEYLIDEASTRPAYDPRLAALRELDLAIESETLEQSSLLAQLDTVVEMVAELKQMVGGRRVEAEVLNPKGQWVKGQIADFGPESFFQAKGDGLAGRLAEIEGGEAQVDGAHGQEVGAWFSGLSQTLPLDVSGGDALKVEQAQTTWLEHLEKGGIWVIPIVVFAALSTLAALFKMVALYSTRISQPLVGHRLADCIQKGRLDEAKQLAQKEPKSCREMWSRAVEHGAGQAELSEEIMAESILERQPQYERFLSLIAVTAAVAPLLGLLGTVTGIIKTFQMMEVFGSGDPKPLIGGISEALITTELGLILAIPALLMHALLSRRAQSLLAKMERASLAMVNGLMKPQAGA